MSTYTVVVRLQADSADALTQRLEGWGIHTDEGEGVMSISIQPEVVLVPDDLQPPPPTPAEPIAAPPPPPNAP